MRRLGGAIGNPLFRGLVHAFEFLRQILRGRHRGRVR